MSNYSGKQKKRIMNKFVMTEISAVDRPAQAHAVSVLMKRADSTDVNKKLALVDEANGHTHLIEIDDFVIARGGGHTSYEGEHSHSFIINLDGTINVGMSEKHTHELSLTAEQIMQKNLTDENLLIGKRPKKPPTVETANPNNGGKEMSKSNDNTADLQNAVEDLQKKLATATAVAELNDEQKAYYKSLNDFDKESFLAKSANDRQSDIDNARTEDPVIYKSLDGTEFRKSDDPRMVGAAKRADALEKKFNAEVEKSQNLELEKRAKAELNHLPGTISAHIELLKAVDGIADSSARENAMSALKAGNHAMKKNFERRGTREEGNDQTALEKLDAMAKQYAKDHNVDFYKAYDAITQTPEGQELYSASLN